MVFALNLFFSSFYCFCFSQFYKIGPKHRFLQYMFVLSPVWLTWLIISGGQYGVGTDYFSYYNIFEGNGLWLYEYKKEYLFVWIVRFIDGKMPPQTCFYVFYLIGFMALLAIISKLDHKHSFIFIILYIAVSSAFNNQLNILRQYVAVDVASYGVFLIESKRGVLKFIVLVFVAAMIHSVSYLFLFILLFKYIPFSNRIGHISLAIAVLIVLLGVINKMTDVLIKIVPPQYGHYMETEFNSALEWKKVFSKLFLVPFYWRSLCLIKCNSGRLSKYELYLFKIGFISFIIRLLFLDNQIFNRVGTCFVILALLPLFFLLRYLFCAKRMWLFVALLYIFFMLYLSKVILFPKAEYLYESIYFI